MSVWIGDTSELQGWLSVLGVLTVPVTDHNDLDALLELTDALRALLEPHATGTIATDEPRIYRATTDGRAALAEALQAGYAGRLSFGVADPQMPHEYRGVRYNGPHVILNLGGGAGRERATLNITLTPAWSSYQAGVAARLPAFFAEWGPRLGALGAYVNGGTTSDDNQTVMMYTGFSPANYAPRAPDARWGFNDVISILTGRTVSAPDGTESRERNRLMLPVRLLGDVRRREDGFIVSRDDEDYTSALAFNLYFERDLTDDEHFILRAAINGWENEFYARFDDDWYEPTLPMRGLSLVRWWVLAARGYGRTVEEMSGNGVNERALRELQDWLLLLPDARVRELVIGVEVVM